MDDASAARSGAHADAAMAEEMAPDGRCTGNGTWACACRKNASNMINIQSVVE
jgi:hypothetical protein